MVLQENASKEKRPGSRWGRILTDNWAFFFAALLLLVLFFLFLNWGDRVFIHPNDTTDSNIAYYKVKRDAWLSGELNESFVSPILGGDENTNRLFAYDLFHNFNFLCIVYLLFPTTTAFLISLLSRVVFSVIGWLFLLRAAYDKETYHRLKNYVLILGLAYGFLPVWPMTMAVSLLPWMIAVCVNAYRKNRILSGIVLMPIIFIGGVSFPLVGCYFVGFLVLALIGYSIRDKRINLGLLFCLIYITAVYALLNYEMIVNVITGNTIRSSFGTAASETKRLDLKQLVNNIQLIIVNGVYHCPPMQRFFLLPLCICSFFSINIFVLLSGRGLRGVFKEPFNLGFLLFWFVCICAALGSTTGAMEPFYRFLPWLRAFSFQRFSYFCPIALYCCFFIVLIKIVKANKKAMAHIAIWITLITVLFGKPTQSSITYSIIKSNIEYYLMDKLPYPRAITVKDFFSEELFDRIKSDIGYDGEWSVAFGFYPSILTYNGIRTLDAYDSGYSSEYKEKFTKLITPYLNEGKDSVAYYLNSGIRAYVFCDDNHYDNADYSKAKPADILIDSDVFREMGGKYVFSLNVITNAEEKQLKLIRAYTDPSQAYSIYLYAID